MYEYNYLKMTRNYEEAENTFQERLNLFMQRYHLNGQQMAAWANRYARRYGTAVTPADISNYLKGKCCPKIDKFQAISNAMGIDVAFFGGYTGKEIRSRFKAIQRRESMTEEELAAEKSANYARNKNYAKYQKAYALVEQLIRDGQVHRPHEIKEILLDCGYTTEGAKTGVPDMMRRFNTCRTKEGYRLQ